MSGTRIATATLNHFKGSTPNQTNMSHMVTRDEDDSIMDLRQIEEMMRAS